MTPQEKKYNGLLIDRLIVKDAESKKRATQSLYGWRYVRLTARQWIQHLEAGHIIQPSDFSVDPETGKYRHLITNDNGVKLWQSTHFVAADADNIRGVEFIKNGKDKNPNGVPLFTSDTGLSALYPTLSDKVYAVAQSVSSMHKEIPHRRYRLIFLFDETIRSEAHYHSILLALSREFPIIAPVERSPAQPIFGNARAGYNRAAVCGNILSLSDYPIPEPETEPEPENRKEYTYQQGQGNATDNALHALLTENNIPFEHRPRGGFFVRCPYSEQHTDGISNRTDAYAWTTPEGAYAYYCSHASCRDRRTWQAFKDGYHIKSNRTRGAKQRLFIKSDAQHIKTDAMDTIRNLLKDTVLEWLLLVYDAEKKQVLIVNTGVATGKSLLMIMTLESLIMLTPTIELAEEAYQKALELGKVAVLHRSRWHNWSKYRAYLENPNLNRADLKMSLTDPDSPICIYPDKCNAIFHKGHSARAKFCETLCDRRHECKYLLQFRLYQDTKQTRLQVYTAQPQKATTDAELKETIHAYGLDRDGTVIVVDETDPIKMIPIRQIDYEEWRRAAAYYHSTPAAHFFEMLLHETTLVQNQVIAEDTAEYVQASNANGLAFRDAIQRAFDAFEVYLRQQHNLTLEQGIKRLQKMFDEVASWSLDDTDIPSHLGQLYDGHPAKIDAQIEALPDNHTRLIDNLSALLDSSRASQTPPVRNIGRGRWEFAVPPSLNAKKIIYLSASDTTPLIRAQLRNVDADITQTDNLAAPWHPSNKLFILNTGRYTPRSLFKVQKKKMYKPSGEEIMVNETAALTARGKEFIRLCIGTLSDGTDTLIVAPGAFCEDGILYDDPLIRKLHALPNSHIATHPHAIGVNRYSELPRAIIFHFEPSLLELVFAAKAIFLNQTLSFERELITLEAHGLTLKEVWRYKDERVQRVYDALCQNVVMQSENRIRPQLYKNKEIWRLSAEPIPAPVTPILFSLADWQAWIDSDRTETFDAFLQARANRSVSEVAAQEDISTSQAYRRTETPRSERTAERDKEIIRLHLEGHTQSDIAMHVSRVFGKTSQQTVSRVINKFTKH